MGDWAMGDRCASRTTARWLHILPEVDVLEQSTQTHPTQPRPIRGSHGTLTNRVVSAIVPGPLRRSTVVRLIWNGIRPIVCNATNGWEWVCYSNGIRMLVSLGSLTTSIRGRSIPGRGEHPFDDFWEFRSKSSAIDLLFELQPYWITGSCTMAIERTRELRRRRHRKVKLINLKKRAEKASKSEKAVIATKIRRITPGAEQLIAAWKLV
jgi:hypothetical protein